MGGGAAPARSRGGAVEGSGEGGDCAVQSRARLPGRAPGIQGASPLSCENRRRVPYRYHGIFCVPCGTSRPSPATSIVYAVLRNLG
eukprot:1184937-Prorocentrum_minimum.AAC.6